MSDDCSGERTHPTWRTAAATVVGYGAILAFILAVLFVLPYALWTVLG